MGTLLLDISSFHPSLNFVTCITVLTQKDPTYKMDLPSRNSQFPQNWENNLKQFDVNNRVESLSLTTSKGIIKIMPKVNEFRLQIARLDFLVNKKITN